MNFKIAMLLTALGFVQLASPGTCSAAPTTESLFQEGVDAFRAGEFAQATRAFRDSTADQPASGTLLNLGIADWRRGRAGAAIVAWEQALWIDPSDRNARNNLEFARQVAQLESPDLAWFEVASTWLPANTWACLASGSLWLVLAMITLPHVLRWRRAGWHQSLAALGLGAFLLSIPVNVGILTRSNIGFILEKNTPLRSTPTEEAETVVSLTAGEPARKVRARGDYVLIRTQSGLGWIKQEQLGLVCRNNPPA